MIAYDEFRKLHHAVTFLGMSGVGKTVLSKELRKSDNWFHFSADYRIGTAYLAEHILDNIKYKIMNMEDKFVAELLRSDSIYISHNITVDNLAPVSTFLGMYGDTRSGGLDKATFLHRQDLYRDAEIESMMDVARFIERAWRIYGCANLVNDASGSLCEVSDPDDIEDPVLNSLAEETLIIYILADERCEEDLKDRARTHPKPLFYNPAFIAPELEGKPEDGAGVDTLDFARPLFPRLLEFRKPRYAAIAERWGFTIGVNQLFDTGDTDATVPCADRFLENVYGAIEAEVPRSAASLEKLERYLNACRARESQRA